MTRSAYISTDILLLMLSLGSCSARHAEPVSRVDEIEACDSLPSTVKSLVSAIAAGDSVTFASLVSYPLERPYPLKNIADSAEMVSYFSTIADDSLVQVIVTSGPAQWQEIGWRGWTIDDGHYLWADDKIYNIPYISAAERRAIAELTEREMASLPDGLGRGWTPVGCFVAESGDIMRLDRNETPSDSPFRLMSFKPGKDKSVGKPVYIMYGTREIEGSIGNVSYRFGSDSRQPARLLEIYPSDSDAHRLTTGDDDKATVTDLSGGYWLDLTAVRTPSK